MSTHDDRRPEETRDAALRPEDARFVARLAEVFTPPEPTPADRARFRSRLDERLARRGRARAWGWLAPAALALGAALVVTLRAPIDEPSQGTPAGAATPTDAIETDPEQQTLLAFVTEDDFSDEDSLPEDYQAIASLMY